MGLYLVAGAAQDVDARSVEAFVNSSTFEQQHFDVARVERLELLVGVREDGCLDHFDNKWLKWLKWRYSAPYRPAQPKIQ